MKKLLLVLLLGIFCGKLYGQDARARLESQRKQLQQEIVQINGMLQKNKSQKADALESLEDLFLKIDRLRELLRLTNRQINGLTSQINSNQANISALEEELEILKEDYASMIVKSRKNASQQNRLMFLFSSDNFWQAIKRVRYMNQYAAYRKQQGENIAKKAETLRELNETLTAQKAVKQELLADNRTVQAQFQQERKKQEKVIQNLRSNESKYAAQIKKKQRQTAKIDKEIDRLIREAIAVSNKKAGTTNVSFALTPELSLYTHLTLPTTPYV